MSEFFIDIPPKLTSKEDLNEILKHLVDLDGSDVFIKGDHQIWISRYGKKIPITRRKISTNEAYNILSIDEVYGQTSQSRINSGKQINTAYEFKEIIPDETNKLLNHSKTYRFRLNAVGCLSKGSDSLTITMRTIPTTPPKHTEIGVEEEIINTCNQADQGLILICGATGNGKSTLLASVIRSQLEDEEGHRNLVTAEEPIEFVYNEVPQPTSFCTQMQVGKHIGNFHEGVVNAMRMAPTTILIGEMRDYETITAGVEASVTGHVVFSTVHSNTVPETFQRMVGVYPKDLQQQAKLDILQAMKMVVCQRLIPTVDGKRTAIREILILDQEIKDRLLLADNLISESFRVLKEYGRPMIKDVEEKFKAGIISEDVYKRQKLNYDSMNKDLC